MDSRIREIEQWIAEAKAGLSDGGREEYVKKLYLLDAEIRAVIKENGTIPGVDSPERRVAGARRSFGPLVTAGAIAGIAVIAAAVWLAGPLSIQSPSSHRAEAPVRTTEQAVPAEGHIPGSISGEEFIVAGWIDPRNQDNGRGLTELASADTPQNTLPPVLDLGPELTDQPSVTGGQDVPANAGLSVMLAMGARDAAGKSGQAQPASFVPSAAPVVIPVSTQPQRPANLERFVAVDIVDKSNQQSEKSVDKLDPDALKRNVEKHFSE